MDTAFDALGDATRRRILEILAGSELPAGAIVDALNATQTISQPAVSQHLKVLRTAGLVTMRADGTRRLYAPDPDGLGTARRWLTAIDNSVGIFDQPLDALATEMARGHRQRSRRTHSRATRAR